MKNIYVCKIIMFQELRDDFEEKYDIKRHQKIFQYGDHLLRYHEKG